MTKKLLGLMLLSVLCANVCVAQLTNSEANKIFGKSISGVQMAIALNTNVITTGTLIGISAEIKNSSTNNISMGETGPATDFLVTLTNDSGGKNELTDVHPLIIHFSMRIKLHPGEIRDWLIPVAIGKGIKPGNYALNASRKFNIGNDRFVLVSNSLKIQIE